MEIKQVVGCRNKWTVTSKPRSVRPLIGAVIHHTATFSDQSTINWFLDPKNESASAHFLIGRDGTVWQFVDEGERAWHAGKSLLTINGVKYENWNMFSLGYELSGDGNQKPYTREQYNSLVTLLSRDVNRWNIKKEFIVGHEQIAPGRKTDPGKFFEWEYVYDRVFDLVTPGGQAPSNFIYSVGA